MTEEELRQLQKDLDNIAAHLLPDIKRMIAVAEVMTSELRHLLAGTPEHREGWQRVQKITQEIRVKYVDDSTPSEYNRTIV